RDLAVPGIDRHWRGEVGPVPGRLAGHIEAPRRFDAEVRGLILVVLGGIGACRVHEDAAAVQVYVAVAAGPKPSVNAAAVESHDGRARLRLRTLPRQRPPVARAWTSRAGRRRSPGQRRTAGPAS